MSDLSSLSPTNSAGVLDMNNAGGGILVGDQVIELGSCGFTRSVIRTARRSEPI